MGQEDWTNDRTWSAKEEDVPPPAARGLLWEGWEWEPFIKVNSITSKKKCGGRERWPVDLWADGAVDILVRAP